MDTKQTVLIVEDVFTNRVILKKILSDEYQVLECENGAQAWELLSDKNNTVDAVLTDILMPEMDGYQLLTKIRQGSLTELPVIAMTGENDLGSEQKALEAGAWDFVPKPYNPEIIRTRLKNALARRQVSVYERMRKMAAHDPLTGLHNRARTFDKARRFREANPDTQFVFIRGDIDNFSLYNTSFGEEEGDKLLCYLGGLLKDIAKDYSRCSFGRVSDDVFCACLPYSGDDTKLRGVIDQIQKKIGEYRQNYLLELSVGVYVIDDPKLSMEECYVRATMAAQKCKRQYGVHLGFYDEAEGRRKTAELTITNEMEAALSQRQFTVYLQPKVSLEKDSLAGAEALVRWQHPEKGLISPGVFIPVFESNGFIAKLDSFVWEETCRMLRSWLDAGCTPMPISVNISRISMYNPQIVSELTGLIEKYNLDIKLLQLEITESAYMTNPELMQQTMGALHEAGFTLLMDDFGSGYSSLNTLKDIDVDILKIDMKFLPVGQNVKKAEIILASVIKMADWLGMDVVVEGVETKEQRVFLGGTSCKYIQGYYYARPMPREDYERDYVFSTKAFAEDDTRQEAAFKRKSTILVIDDDEMDRQIIKGFLQERFNVHTCAGAEEALLYLKRNRSKVRLIMVDYVMPGMNGLDFLTFCQDDPMLHVIPQIIITGNDSVEAQITGFQRGAYDYIAKPLVKEVVLARVNHVMEVSRICRKYEAQEYDFRSAALCDPFTGMLNKNSFLDIAGRHLENDESSSTALLVIDCDSFKDVNDRFGHMFGDTVLKELAMVLSREFRKSDLVGRFGGDEFMVLMRGWQNREAVRRKADEVVKAVAAECARDEDYSIGISVGVAFREDGDDIDALFSRADRALYCAKSTGKAKAVIYGEKPPSPDGAERCD